MGPVKNKAITKKARNLKDDQKKLMIEEPLEQTNEPVLGVLQVLKDVQQLPCPLKQICELTDQKKEEIKLSHPSLASYYYLKQRQRAKYFHQINHNYRKSMKPLQPPGSAPRKKTIKFKKRFQIKLFGKEQNTKKINQKKIFTERQTRNVHFK